MNIQWFPGHMTKALRLMQENVKIVDAVGYVLDARAPFSSFNPAFEKLINNKPCLFILYKCDLADNSKIQLWRKYFESQGQKCIAVSASIGKEIAKIVDGFKSVTAEKIARYKAKGIKRAIRVMIIGVPNCGKSTIINAIAKKKATITGDRPGVTRGKQWVAIDNWLELLDTPGTCWSNYQDQQVAQRLTFIGSIKDDVVDLYEVSLLLIQELKTLYPENFLAKYKVDLTKSNEEILNDICHLRGFIVKGGETDLLRGAKALLDDFRKGKLGKVTFDTPEI